MCYHVDHVDRSLHSPVMPQAAKPPLSVGLSEKRGPVSMETP